MTLTIEQLEKICIKALNKAYQVHEGLGAKGEEEIQRNRFGEAVLRADIELERAVIGVLRDANVPMRIISEEHGTTDISENPTYLGVLDGLDGTDVYRKKRGRGRYGTMLGVFSNLDPKYKDYIFSGIMEHPTKRLFFASKGKGSFVILDGEKKLIHCSKRNNLSKTVTKIYADKLFDKYMGTRIIHDTFLLKLRGYAIHYLASSAAHYIDLASGYVDLVLECTRKDNLEIAVAYGLVTEAGGVVVACNGTSLKQKRYLQFGQDTYIPIISASTKQLAKKLIEHIT